MLEQLRYIPLTQKSRQATHSADTLPRVDKTAIIPLVLRSAEYVVTELAGFGATQIGKLAARYTPNCFVVAEL